MMLKLFIGLAVCLFAVNAQEGTDFEIEEREPDMECFNGYQNLEFTGTMKCPKTHVCQTKIEMQPRSRMYVYVQCKPQNVCENNGSNNEQQCYKSRGAKTCHFCCDTPLCNSMESVMEELDADLEEP